MKADEKSDKLMRDSLQAGFNAGWLAAHVSLADQADEQGLAVLAKWMRERGQKPDRVEIVEMGGEPGAVA